MNLYKHVFEHFSQKDSAIGSQGYFLASNDRGAYDVVYQSSPVTVDMAEEHANDKGLSAQDVSLAVAAAVNRVIKAKGEMFLDDLDYDDLYYGRTYTGWELVKENITLDEFTVCLQYKMLDGVYAKYLWEDINDVIYRMGYTIKEYKGCYGTYTTEEDLPEGAEYIFPDSIESIINIVETLRRSTWFKDEDINPAWELKYWRNK